MINYIRFIFENVEPLRIADDSTSQSGQVNTLTYVPGSALRGAVVNAFAKAGKLETYKTKLLSDHVAFMNAYIIVDGKELIPSLKGFYEDKTDEIDGVKQIENFLKNGAITEGNKRAALGKYCYLDGDCIHYTGIRLGSDMKINKGKNGDDRNVFRNQYVIPGYRFAGCIAVSDDDSNKLTDEIIEVLRRLQEEDSLVLGGSRSYGYGKCIIVGEVEKNGQLPFDEYAITEKTTGPVYMALLSDVAMVNDFGETVGIDEAVLGKKLEVGSLHIQDSATSVIDIRGYNRTWHTWVPSSKMYEKGSVFKLDFDGETISAEALRKVMDEGIGIRINEGYGRVLFLKDYEIIENKKEIASNKIAEDAEPTKEELTGEEDKTLQIAARGYYMNCIDKAVNKYLAERAEKGKNIKLANYHLSASQRGAIEAIFYKNMFSEDGGFSEVIAYLEHAEEKDESLRVQKQYTDRGKVVEYIKRIKNNSLSQIFEGIPEQIMGIDSQNIFELDENDQKNDQIKQENRIKQQLIISEIKMMNREGE